MDDAENSTPFERAPHLKQYAFKPGQSGNPGGRPRGLALLVRASTKDGEELVQFWLDVMRNVNEDVGDRLKASQLLAERGFGKVEVLVDDEAKAPKTLRVVAG